MKANSWWAGTSKFTSDPAGRLDITCIHAQAGCSCDARPLIRNLECSASSCRKTRVRDLLAFQPTVSFETCPTATTLPSSHAAFFAATAGSAAARIIVNANFKARTSFAP